jgi:hypothetical protein
MNRLRDSKSQAAAATEQVYESDGGVAELEVRSLADAERVLPPCLIT